MAVDSMPPAITSVVASRLEKAAVDNGFDREFAPTNGWLEFGSTQCSLRIWLSQVGAEFLAAFSKHNVAAALAEFGPEVSESLPQGAAGARVVQDIPSLHHLLRRAFQLGKSLPDELLHIFNAQTAGLPRKTEAERLVIQRVGQNVFRDGLMEYWEGRCAITGLEIPGLLRASHIKPWAACETDPERLDVFNGFLLAANWDAAFDQGFVTITDDGEVIAAAALDERARRLLGLEFTGSRVAIAGHRTYLHWHREKVFRGAPGGLPASKSRISNFP